MSCFGPIGPSTTQELIRRSMPNLNNQSRMRLPQPSGLAGNLNRQHGSDSGLRPPSTGVGIRPPICSTVNGSSLVRPQFKVPQPPPQAQVATNNIRGPAAMDPVRPSQLVSRDLKFLVLLNNKEKCPTVLSCSTSQDRRE